MPMCFVRDASKVSAMTVLLQAAKPAAEVTRQSLSVSVGPSHLPPFQGLHSLLPRADEHLKTPKFLLYLLAYNFKLKAFNSSQ